MREAEADHLRLGDLGQHLDELRLDELITGEGARELLARFRVIERALITRTRRADRAPRDSIARLREATEGSLEATRFGQMRGSWEANIFENQLGGNRRAHRELAVDIAGGKAGRATFDHKPGYAFIDLRPHDGEVSDRAVGDPALAAVQNPTVAILTRARFHPARIGAVVRLGQTEASDELALRHLGQEAPLLLLAAVGVNRVHR